MADFGVKALRRKELVRFGGGRGRFEYGLGNMSLLHLRILLVPLFLTPRASLIFTCPRTQSSYSPLRSARSHLMMPQPRVIDSSFLLHDDSTADAPAAVPWAHAISSNSHPNVNPQAGASFMSMADHGSTRQRKTEVARFGEGRTRFRSTDEGLTALPRAQAYGRSWCRQTEVVGR